MWNYAIGLSGLDAARKGLDVIGNNIANAATEGYHRQRMDLSPAWSRLDGDTLVGGGVDVRGITRVIDELLEKEILSQKASLGQISQENATLQTVEAAFGELTGEAGLSTAIDEFFAALSELSAHPGQIIWQDQVVTAAEKMAGQFRTLGEFLNDLLTQIQFDLEQTIGQVNTLTSQIADLNASIERIEITGGQANNLRDQRDELISQLAELMEVQTQSRDYGVVDVSAGGIPVVTAADTIELESGLIEGGILGVTPAGSYNYQTAFEGGRVGALLSLGNVLVAGIGNDLDNLARTIVRQMNEYHVQGIGSAGSFTELTGWTMASENLSESVFAVTDGSLYIRVIDTATGEITRHEIDVDAASDTLSTIAAKIAAIDGVTASVANSRLTIQADSGYEFDFLPAVLPEPTASSLNGSSPPTVSVSGIYSGNENGTFTFTVSGAGTVGNGTLEVAVTDEDGDTVATLNLGSGYAAGDVIELDNGVRIAVSAGDFAAGDSFEVDAFADTDTAGLLAALGINTFFCGHDASEMAVCERVSESPTYVATALGAEATDNTNVARMLSFKDEQSSDLDSLTPREFYRRLVTGIGQDVSLRQIRQDNVEVLINGLAGQQNETSGVDVNEEAAMMLVFERMFEAMAKYLNTVNEAIKTIMDLV